MAQKSQSQTQDMENLSQNYLGILGNIPRKSKFDEDLARRVNEETEREEREEELRRKIEEKRGKKEKNKEEVQSETPEVKKEPLILPAKFAPEDYILLSGKSHGDYSYPDLLVSMHRLRMNTEVEKAALKLRYNISNTAKEKNGRDYIGNINWEQALKLNLSLGGRTLSLRQFADFLLLLKSGNAVDGNGRKVPESKLTEILNEITGVREPWRSEWLDADFKYLNKKLWLYFEHRLDANGNLNADYKKELENCLRTKGDKINLSGMNYQGMPVETGNDFYYCCPDKDNKSVAGFGAGSDAAGLGCSWDPSGAGSSLGVRLALQQERAAQKNN